MDPKIDKDAVKRQNDPIRRYAQVEHDRMLFTIFEWGMNWSNHRPWAQANQDLKSNFSQKRKNTAKQHTRGLI
jgi:hypothetical protein